MCVLVEVMSCPVFSCVMICSVYEDGEMFYSFGNDEMSVVWLDETFSLRG